MNATNMIISDEKMFIIVLGQMAKNAWKQRKVKRYIMVIVMFISVMAVPPQTESNDVGYG